MPADNQWNKMPTIFLDEPLAELPREGKLFWLCDRISNPATKHYWLAVSTRTVSPSRNNTFSVVRYKSSGKVKFNDADFVTDAELASAGAECVAIVIVNEKTKRSIDV